MPLDPPVITATLPSSFPTIIPVRAQFPGLHADCIRKVALQRDTGRQRAVKNAHLGDLAVLVEQDEEYAVDRGVSDLQPEECGVVGLAAEDLHIGVVGRQSVDGLYGFHGGLAAGDWLIAERAVQHHVLGEQTGEGVFVCAAVNAVDEGLQGVAVRGERGHGYSSSCGEFGWYAEALSWRRSNDRCPGRPSV